jgi:hypothetical protein
VHHQVQWLVLKSTTTSTFSQGRQSPNRFPPNRNRPSPQSILSRFKPQKWKKNEKQTKYSIDPRLLRSLISTQFSESHGDQAITVEYDTFIKSQIASRN